MSQFSTFASLEGCGPSQPLPAVNWHLFTAPTERTPSRGSVSKVRPVVATIIAGRGLCHDPARQRLALPTMGHENVVGRAKTSASSVEPLLLSRRGFSEKSIFNRCRYTGRPF